MDDDMRMDSDNDINDSNKDTHYMISHESMEQKVKEKMMNGEYDDLKINSSLYDTSNSTKKRNKSPSKRPAFSSTMSNNSKSKTNPNSKASKNASKNTSKNTDWIMSLVEYDKTHEIGICFLNIINPIMIIYQFVDNTTYDVVKQLLYSRQPQSIVMSESQKRFPLWNVIYKYLKHRNPATLRRKFFNKGDGIARTKEMCTQTSIKRLSIEGTDLWLAMSAINAIMEHVRGTPNEYSKNTIDIRYENIKSFMKIDPNTIINLEIVSNKPSLFSHNKNKNIKNKSKYGDTLLKIIDKCETKMGKRLLLSNLFQPLNKVELIQNRLDSVEELNSLDNVRRHITNMLKKTLDIEMIAGTIARKFNMSTKASVDYSQKRIKAILNLRNCLHKLNDMADILEPCESKMLRHIRNFLRHGRCNIDDDNDTETEDVWPDTDEESSDNNNENIWNEMLNDINDCFSEEIAWKSNQNLMQQKIDIANAFNRGVDSKLDVHRALNMEYYAIIESLFKDLKKSNYVEGMQLKYTKKGWRIKIPINDDMEIPKVYIERVYSRNRIECTTWQISGYNWRQENMFETILTSVFEHTNDLTLKLQNKMSFIHKLCEKLALLDIINSFSLYSNVGCVRPHFSHNGNIQIKNGLNPILVSKYDVISKEIIPNTIMLTPTSNVHIIKGANASGKTTYIKQIALLVIMAQIGCLIPASYASIRLVDKLFTRLNDYDNMLANESTFFNEAKDIAYIMNNISNDSKSLILLDELGRSTSYIDGYGLAWSVIEYLQKTSVYTLFVTHFDLYQMSFMYPTIKCKCFIVDELNGELKYTYKMKEINHFNDSNMEHYGIKCAQNIGFPNEIISAAIKTKDYVDKKQKLYKCLVDKDLETACIIKEYSDLIRSYIKANPNASKIAIKEFCYIYPINIYRFTNIKRTYISG